MGTFIVRKRRSRTLRWPLCRRREDRCPSTKDNRRRRCSSVERPSSAVLAMLMPAMGPPSAIVLPSAEERHARHVSWRAPNVLPCGTKRRDWR